MAGETSLHLVLNYHDLFSHSYTNNTMKITDKHISRLNTIGIMAILYNEKHNQVKFLVLFLIVFIMNVK